MKYSDGSTSDKIGFGPAFFYPKLNNRYYLISWTEAKNISDEVIDLSFIEAVYYGNVIEHEHYFADKKLSNKLESFLTKKINEEEDKFEKEYINNVKNRMLESESNMGEWITACVEVWDINTDNSSTSKKEFDYEIHTDGFNKKITIEIYNPKNKRTGLAKAFMGSSSISIELRLDKHEATHYNRIDMGDGISILFKDVGIEMKSDDGQFYLSIDMYKGNYESNGYYTNQDLETALGHN
jgi:hypothetical protein